MFKLNETFMPIFKLSVGLESLRPHIGTALAKNPIPRFVWYEIELWCARRIKMRVAAAAIYYYYGTTNLGWKTF